MTPVVCLACLLGCGRIGFEVSSDANGDADLCTRGDVILCEGFEGDTSGWTAFADPTAATGLTTVERHAGAAALEVRVDGPGDVAVWYRSDPRLGAAAIYVRGWVLLPSPDLVGHVNLLTLQSSDGGFSLIAIEGEIRGFADTAPDLTIAAAPRDRWFCLELGVEVDPVAGVFQASLDGSTPIIESGVNTQTEGLTHFYLGAAFTGAAQATPIRYFLDDVVVSSAPIGCDERI